MPPPPHVAWHVAEADIPESAAQHTWLAAQLALLAHDSAAPWHGCAFGVHAPAPVKPTQHTCVVTSQLAPPHGTVGLAPGPPPAAPALPADPTLPADPAFPAEPAPPPAPALPAPPPAAPPAFPAAPGAPASLVVPPGLALADPSALPPFAESTRGFPAGSRGASSTGTT